jgi:hypothetical protein
MPQKFWLRLARKSEIKQIEEESKRANQVPAGRSAIFLLMNGNLNYFGFKSVKVGSSV